MNEYGRRCHERAGSALLDLGQTHLGEYTDQWRPTRSLNPGRRDVRRMLQRPGRTDRGGVVTDGGTRGSCYSPQRFMTAQEGQNE